MQAVEHKSSQEAMDYLLEQLKVLVKEEKWMVAAWRIKDGKLERCVTTTWQFPDGDWSIASCQLNAYGNELIQSKAPLPDDPLPTADFLKGMGEAAAKDGDEEKPMDPFSSLRSPFDDK